MITIAFDTTTGLWLAVLPNGSFLAFRRDDDGHPVPDLFSSSQRALLEARLSLRDNNNSVPYLVDNSGLAGTVRQEEAIAAK